MKINMATGLLITSLSGMAKRINDVIKDHLLKTLYVQIYLKKLKLNSGSTQFITNSITNAYIQASKYSPNLDVRVILNELKLNAHNKKLVKKKNYDIDIIILPKNYKSEDVSSLLNSKKNISVILTEDLYDNAEDDGNDIPLKVYNNVVLGGTFDRLHAGHKILLTQALLQCSREITVGVTDGEMIKNKILWELIESCETRINNVKTFIEEVDNTVKCNVVPITDIYGPTKCDPHLDMIVVSAETEKGGHKINQYRKEKGMNELDISVIDLAEDGSSTAEEESKISSSNLRKRLLGTRIREPEKKPGTPSKPYIIGLTGGICSGKSSIGQYLRTLGAEVIDCDRIAHELYKSGTELFFEVVQKFGNEIVGENGEINRKKLGAIVFNDPKKLDILNKMLWPNIVNKALEQCRELYEKSKKNIIILEAAVLLRAGWHEKVHEVWTAIISPQEAIARLKKRDNLSEEQAVLRLESQPSNSEQVAVANVVFCSLWSYECTRKQVLTAWKIVNNELNSK